MNIKEKIYNFSIKYWYIYSIALGILIAWIVVSLKVKQFIYTFDEIFESVKIGFRLISLNWLVDYHEKENTILKNINTDFCSCI